MAQLGQGANVALVDAWKLSKAVGGQCSVAAAGTTGLHVSTADRVANAVEAYSNDRRLRMWFYQLNSRFLTPVFQSHSRTIGWLRDTFMGPLCMLPPTRWQMAAAMCGALSPWIVKTIPDEEYLGFLEDPCLRSGKC